MGLELFMIGLPTRDMAQALEFYRRLGLAIPDDADGRTHVEVKMGAMTFFLDSNPTRWDTAYTFPETTQPNHPFVLEFYLKTRGAVEAKYAEMTGYGYASHQAPFITTFNMCFAFILDPDGNLILLSGDNAPGT